MRLWVCGARGTTPAPGPEFVRYGGHTACVAITPDGRRPTLILDGGTGLRRLSQMLEDRPFRGTMLLGHLHWDHTHGIPFFRSGDRPGSQVTVLLPAQGDPEEVLALAISPPHFPVRPRELRGNWQFESLEPGEREIEGFSVLALDIPHLGGRMFGYRISDDKTTIAYLSDHSPLAVGPGPNGLGEYHRNARTLAEGVDLLIHDAQYTAEEFQAQRRGDHSAVEYAIGLAHASGARRLLLFHHDPPRTDDELDAIVAAHQDAGLPIHAAAEGSVIDLRADRP